MVQFGGADTRSVRMLDSFQHGFWLCDQVGIGSPEIQNLLRVEYIEKGRALFGRGPSSEMFEQFRQAGGRRLAGIDDHEIKAIITFAVQRVRNYGNILQLKQGTYKYASVRAIVDDGKTCSFCSNAHGQRFLVSPAAQIIKRYAAMMPGDYAQALHFEKAMFPPFHRTCRCEPEGVGVLDDPEGPMLTYGPPATTGVICEQHARRMAG